MSTFLMFSSTNFTEITHFTFKLKRKTARVMGQRFYLILRVDIQKNTNKTPVKFHGSGHYYILTINYIN